MKMKVVLSGAAALLLAGCVTMGQHKGETPIPPGLLAKMNGNGMTAADPILIRVFKKENELEVWKRTTGGEYARLKTYPICRWSGQLGPKIREGDRQTPEGFYTVGLDQLNPNSAFHLSFDLGFPNELDRALGRTGSALMIHGACSSSGCYAMTDDGAAELYALAREALRGGQDGIQVQALPFRFTPENLAEQRSNRHVAFWRNLKEGSDHFEVTRRPPRVASCGGRYVFAANSAEPFVASEPCPAHETDPAVASLVRAKAERDDLAAARLVEGGRKPVTYTFADGSMHPSFKAILRTSGPERLQKLTSGPVEIGSTLAALAEPSVSVGDGEAR
ncbi:L,D-transpeptidase family protein [Enterovirga sp. CN4-39]|uniref:L,D-transpeptidase family protein n=1 Tax=Enterovirga sp. CN4-39 TaxID=3400910 RepID=UPI003C07D5EB